MRPHTCRLTVISCCCHLSPQDLEAHESPDSQYVLLEQDSELMLSEKDQSILLEKQVIWRLIIVSHISGALLNNSWMCLHGQVNGSSIRPWWIHHHYWAMITMALLLTMPVDSRAVQSFVRRFLWWSTFQVQALSHPPWTTHQRSRRP